MFNKMNYSVSNEMVMVEEGNQVDSFAQIRRANTGEKRLLRKVIVFIVFYELLLSFLIRFVFSFIDDIH